MMETNFFKSLIALQVAGDWKISIAKETADKLIVSVLFFNGSIGDDACKKVPPILLKGTAQELDEAPMLYDSPSKYGTLGCIFKTGSPIASLNFQGLKSL
jgi:hypothetical protein